MNPDRKTAVAVGVLFITGTVAGMLSYAFSLSIVDDQDYLIMIAKNDKRVIIGAILELIMGVAVVSIPYVMYSIFRATNPRLAISYVGARTLEGVGYIVAVVFLLSLVSLSQDFVEAGSPADSYFSTLGETLKVAREWTGTVGVTIFFSISALILNYLWYITRLVPRFIAVWGLIGAVLYLVAGVLGMFGLDLLSTLSVSLQAPLGVNEMFLAVWLIVRGFSRSALVLPSAPGGAS